MRAKWQTALNNPLNFRLNLNFQPFFCPFFSSLFLCLFLVPFSCALTSFRFSYKMSFIPRGIGGKEAKMKKNYTDWLFLGTLLFFGLSFVNILFSWLGLICMITPFIMAYKTGKKPWCTSYCPRSSLFTKALGKISLGKQPPKGLLTKETGKFVIQLFCVNLMLATMSTFMVASGRIPVMDYPRFLMMFPIQVDFPQLISIAAPGFLIHASYRIFSIMMTSTIIGLILGILYRPRAWCAICPIQTLTTPIKLSA
jgi:hypothetical protein